MNKINPIYLIILFITFFTISFISLQNVKKDIKSIEKEKKEFLKLSSEYKEYKTNWFNKKEIEKKIDRIAKSINFKNEKILVAQSGNIIKLKIESKNEKILEKFLKRVLNEKFIIKKLSVNKDSIYVEVGMKI